VLRTPRAAVKPKRSVGAADLRSSNKQATINGGYIMDGGDVITALFGNEVANVE